MSEIKKAIIGALTSAVIGGYIGAWFNDRKWKEEEAYKALISEISTAGEAYEDISRLINTRRIKLYRYLDKTLPNKKHAQPEWAAYIAAKEEFDTHALKNFYIAKYKINSGVASRYSQVSRHFELVEKAIHEGHHKQIQDSADELGKVIWDLNDDVFKSCESGKIGRFQNNNSVWKIKRPWD